MKIKIRKEEEKEFKCINCNRRVKIENSMCVFCFNEKKEEVKEVAK